MLQKILLIFVFLFCAHMVSRACECSEYPKTIFEQYDFNDFVFTGKIIKVETLAERDPRKYDLKVRVEVTRSFKGRLKPGDVVMIENGTNSCSRAFAPSGTGTEQLFITNMIGNDNDGWITFCSRGGEVNSSAAADIAYLKKLDKVLGKTRVAGRFRFAGETNQTRRLKTLRLKGKGFDQIVKADNNGMFEIYDLRPGIYWFIARNPFPQKHKLEATINGRDYQLDEDRSADEKASAKAVPGHFRLTVRKGKLYDFDIYGAPLNLLRGVLSGADGLPITDAQIFLETGNELYPRSQRVGITGEKPNGFSFSSIVPDEYYLKAVIDIPENDRSVRHYIYYPGTTDKNKATKIKIKAGQYIRELVFRIPLNLSRN